MVRHHHLRRRRHRLDREVAHPLDVEKGHPPRRASTTSNGRTRCAASAFPVSSPQAFRAVRRAHRSTRLMPVRGSTGSSRLGRKPVERFRLWTSQKLPQTLRPKPLNARCMCRRLAKSMLLRSRLLTLPGSSAQQPHRMHLVCLLRASKTSTRSPTHLRKLRALFLPRARLVCHSPRVHPVWLLRASMTSTRSPTHLRKLRALFLPRARLVCHSPRRFHRRPRHSNQHRPHRSDHRRPLT